MIPKIIHYCWLSGDPYPEEILQCIESWKRILPDYQFVLWDTKRFDLSSSTWVRQAFEAKKYAFAADYIRMYALYHFGGIYLDSDVEVLKSFDDLLDLPYFIGQENTPSGVEAATIGCEKGWPLAKLMLDRYDKRAFKGDDGHLDVRALPYLLRWCIESNYHYKLIRDKAQFCYDDDTICVFPVDYFSPIEWSTKKADITPDTYSVHHFASSWMSTSSRTKRNNAVVKIKEMGLSVYKKAASRFLKDVSLISNQSIVKEYYDYYHQNYQSPLLSSKVYGEDFLSLVELFRTGKDLHLSFIPQHRSKHTSSNSDFYPVAVVDSTDIEIHFIHCLTQQEAEDYWNIGMKCINTGRLVVAFVSTTSESDELFGRITLPKFKLSASDPFLRDLRTDNCDYYQWSRIKIMKSIRRRIRQVLRQYEQ